MPRSTGGFLQNAALYRGVLGDSRAWRIVFVLFAIGRLRRAIFARTPIHVATEVLAPGQSVVLTSMERPPRGRRARRQQAKSSG